MEKSDDKHDIPDTVPLFPLPDIALFPGALLPLHVFEPRYRAMVASALSTHKCIAVAMLRDGFEPLYYTRHAPIHRIVGIGRILAVEEAHDGRYYILLQGMARAEVVRELHDELFRKGHIRPLNSFCSADCSAAAHARERLRQLIRRCRLTDSDTRRAWLKLIQGGADLAHLSDTIAAETCLPAQLRQALLEELDAANRTTALIEQLLTTARINAVTRSQHRRHARRDLHWN